MTNQYPPGHQANDLGIGANYLNPDVLETSNRILLDIEQIIKQTELKPPIAIATIYFNKKWRTFHSHLVRGNWPIIISGHDREDELAEMRERIRNLFSEAKSGGTKFESYQPLKKVADSLGNENLSELMEAYSDLPTDRNEFVAGLLYSTFLHKLSPAHKRTLAFLQVDVEEATKTFESTIVPWAWNSNQTRFHSLRGAGQTTLPQIPNDKITSSVLRRNVVFALSKYFYLNNLDEFMKGNPKRGSRRSLVLIPIYDVWNAGRGYGGFWGVLFCVFANDQSRGRFITGEYTHRLVSLLAATERLADAYFASGLTKIVKEKIVPPYDWIKLFVQRLHWIQDWERVTVHEGGGVKYRYCHVKPTGNSIEFDWAPCSRQNEETTCTRCTNRSGEKLTFRWKRDMESSDEGRHPILNRRLVKELSTSEEAAMREIDIEFEFPPTAVVPVVDGQIERHFGLAIGRQHIAALRTLLPIVRARRAALRNAVSAIMGRNMSHNIGSHVLARYSSKIKGDLIAAVEGRSDHRTDFLMYLQRRMDFLAEIATSDRAFWAQPLSLKEQIGRLSYDQQKKRFGGDKEPIVLSYITGKESLKASVEWEDGQAGDDIWFSCPGGEVGAHALFVILENIIRNSARHGADDGRGMVGILVRVNDRNPNSDFLDLEIIDPRSRWISSDEADGIPKWIKEINRIVRKEPFLEEDGSPKSKNWGVREMQICAHYLRGLSLSELEARPDVKYPNLKAGVHDLNDGSNCLKYMLHLQRAKLMAVVAKNVVASWGDAATLQKYGILMIPAEDPPDWVKVASAARGYGFLAIEDCFEIPTASDLRALLPVRTFTLSVDKINMKIAAATGDGSQGIAWMEPLHEEARAPYFAKRKEWQRKSYWGMVALEKRDSELRNGSWRQVQLDPNEKDGNRRDRPMWPLADDHVNMIDSLRNSEVAALWIGHPKPDHFKASRTGPGGQTRLHQAAMPPIGQEPSYRWIHVEPIFSDSPHGESLQAATATGLCQELLTAAVPRVAVLDERVQSSSATTHRKIAMSQIWPSIGVWVPDKGACNLDAPQASQVRAFLCKPTAHEEHYPIDFLVIHLTVLERLYKDRANRSDDLAKTLSDLKKDTLARDAEVIVVTGRGVPAVTRASDPDYLPDARYLPVSAILEYLVARPSKLALMRVLWSASQPATQDEKNGERK